MGKLGVEEWNLKLAGMYKNVQSCVRVCKGLSDEFEVKFGVHQGSVLSPLFYIILLDALSRGIRRFQLTSLSAFTRKRVMLWTRQLYRTEIDRAGYESH